MGEPWNSAAALAGEGWVVATSATLAPRHPEKVLIANDALADQRPDDYAALQEAIIAACKYCDSSTGRAAVVDLLESRKLFALGREPLANALAPTFQRGRGLEPEKGPLVQFYQGEANRATRDRAAWLMESLSGPAALALEGTQRRACLEAFHDRLHETVAHHSSTQPKAK